MSKSCIKDRTWKMSTIEESAYIRTRKTKNLLNKIKFNINKATTWKENLKIKKYVVKSQGDNELLCKFRSSLPGTLHRVSSFKDKKNCATHLPVQLERRGPYRPPNYILGFSNKHENKAGDSLCLDKPTTDEVPPAPPPRNAAMKPPSLPPLPSTFVPFQKILPHAPGHNPHLTYSSQTSNFQGLQNKFPSSYYACDRNSPSSGFYSCTPISSGCSSVNLYDLPVHDQPNMHSIPILQSVKSRQLLKPEPQTAVPVSIYTRPPVHSISVTEPPRYASSIYTKTTQSRNPTSCGLVSSSMHSQSASPPNYTNSGERIYYQSPVPEWKAKSTKEDRRRDCKVRNYSPQAFKFFMEQRMENVMKSHKQRIYRQIQLETEMEEIGLNVEEKNQMRKMLYQKESNFIRLKRSKLDKSMFTKIQVIGIGAFGEVSLVRKNNSHQLYAMKTLRKADILRRNQVAHVKAERDILAEADNDWVVKLYFSFQDDEYLYFVMEYIPGGDLMSLLIKLGIFEEELAKFYLAELTCAVESVHKIGFIHRDIKPDNILIDRDGHIKLTDFGLCTGFRWTHSSQYYENGHSCQNILDLSHKWNINVDCKCAKLKPLERRRGREEHRRCLAHSLVGTPNYIAPEVLLRTGYSQLCDWWSVGVVLYEMLIGYPPFRDDSPFGTQEKIINWQNTLHIPQNANISSEAVDLIMQLCTSSEKRLGRNADEVKQHPFLASINFAEGVRKLKPPYIPKIIHSTDTSNFDPIQSDESGVESSSLGSDSSEETVWPRRNEFFLEFTFRRFFDDDAGVSLRERTNGIEDQEGQNAIYV